MCNWKSNFYQHVNIAVAVMVLGDEVNGEYKVEVLGNVHPPNPDFILLKMHNCMYKIITGSFCQNIELRDSYTQFPHHNAKYTAHKISKNSGQVYGGLGLGSPTLHTINDVLTV